MMGAVLFFTTSGELAPQKSLQEEGKIRGMEASDAKRLKALEGENRRPKKLLAEQMLNNAP